MDRKRLKTLKIYESNAGKRIVVDAHIDKHHNFERFEALTQTAGSYIIEFTNNITLKREMLLHLHKILHDTRNNVQLKVKHPFLSSYLAKLDIKHKHDFHMFEASHTQRKHFDIVLLAGSAGSFENIMDLLSLMPVSQTSYVIVQHISKDAHKSLDGIIENKTPHNVCYIEDAMVIMPSMIYIVPPAFHCEIESGVAYLRDGEPVNYAKPSIDVTLASMARYYRHKLAIVLLCGYSFDGTKKLTQAKTSKSTVLCIKPQVCKDADSIPQKAIATGQVDRVMDLSEMAKYLKSHTYIKEDKVKLTRSFLKRLHEHYGYDFESYQIQSIMRRIEVSMLKQGYEDYEEFYEAVLSNKITFTKLFFELSINVTQFLRQSNSYEYMKNSLLPKISKYGHLKMWCAGVSSGEEAYTLAFLLQEKGMLEKSIIYATDFNPYILQIAKNGLYHSSKIDKVTFKDSQETQHFKNMFDRYGDLISVNESLRKIVHFFTHNLATDSSIGEFQVIVCKNVMIYFDEELQHRVFKLFYNSLAIDGYLVLGESESILSEQNRRLFKPINPQAKIYQKVL